MGIENSSFEAKKSQNTLKTTNDTDIKDILEKETLANKLSKINNILDSISVSEKEEDEYRNILKNQDKNTIKNLSQKPPIEIQQYLMQTQINELESKGEENLTDKEIDKYLSLQKSLIAVEKSETQLNEDVIVEENKKQLKPKKLIKK